LNIDIKDSEIRKEIEGRWGGIDKWSSVEDMWHAIDRQGAKWWEDLPLLPWAKCLYAEMKKLGEVCILTAPSDNPSCAAGKVASIAKNFDTKDFLIGRPKHLCASSRTILVDDRPENCHKFFDYGGHSFLWPNSVKMLRLGKGEQAVDDCIDFVKSVTVQAQCPEPLPWNGWPLIKYSFRTGI